jgi:hypothetical protein
MKLSHSFLEIRHFLTDYSLQRSLCAHWVRIPVFGELCVEGCGHCLLATKGQSVIEEKGEGFENGKCLVGLLGVPSTSFILPCYVSRLNIVAYKSVMHPE